MQFTVNELTYSTSGLARNDGLKSILERNGFGLVELKDPREDVVHVELWTDTGPDGPCGFPCGRAVRDFGIIAPRFTLTLDTGRLERSRVHGVLTDILNANVKG